MALQKGDGPDAFEQWGLEIQTKFREADDFHQACQPLPAVRPLLLCGCSLPFLHMHVCARASARGRVCA